MKYLYPGEHRVGAHGFAGQCVPEVRGSLWQNEFSVGVFPWVLKADGKGLKRGKVLVRVRGLATAVGREKVLRRAREVCRALMDAGTSDWRGYSGGMVMLIDDTEYMRPSHAARVIGCTPGRVSQLMDDGTLRHVVHFGERRVLASDVRKYAEYHPPTGRPRKQPRA